MTQEEMTEWNLGDSLDDLMNLDPRGYGVCKILYAGARKKAGEPVCLHAAKKIKNCVKNGDAVVFISGFVLKPFNYAETDGFVGTILLANTLALAYNICPVIVCQEENMQAAEAMAKSLNYKIGKTIEEIALHTIVLIPFSKDKKQAEIQAKQISEKISPAMVITSEAPGENSKGVYHNAIGQDITCLQAKMDFLFTAFQQKNVATLSIGDLGNEIGMGTLSEHIKKYVPYTAVNECTCGCKGGILANTSADVVVTATTSDWGCYALCAMTAYLNGKENLCCDGIIQEKTLELAVKNGLIDMYGQAIPAIDGIGKELHSAIATAMTECVKHSLKLKEKTSLWFEKTNEKAFFQKNNL